MDSPQSSHVPVIVSTTPARPHVVKIRVNPVEQVPTSNTANLPQSRSNTVRINISSDYDDMRGSSPYYFYASGQSSPSDTLDSGTCSDLDGGTPPPLPGKTAVTVTVNHRRGGSLTSSGAEAESDDEISCDSLNSSELDGSTPEDRALEPTVHGSRVPQVKPHPPGHEGSNKIEINKSNIFNDTSLRPTNGTMNPVKTIHHRDTHDPRDSGLDNIRGRASKISFSEEIDHKALTKKTSNESNSPVKSVVEECTYEERKKNPEHEVIDPDSFYNFHLNEKNCEPEVSSARADDEDSFAGCKGYQEGDPAASTIRSSKGTIRGVKNRVRAGIATFLQMHATKSWQERDAGKIVMYTTTMGIVRGTYQMCLKVRQILRTHLVKFDERDVFMSREVQAEIRDRMSSEQILVPQVFIDGQYIGDADVIERLNESGELRRILKPYKSPDACNTCQVCGGYRLLPCAVCNGSKKSVHRNHFTTELVALKCMNCDEVGLVKCYAC